VSNAVMVGFLSAVGVNIVLGQLANLTGYKATGGHRVIRAVNTVIHPGQFHVQSLAVGMVTVALILLLERTRLGPLGLVVAVILTSAAVAALGWGSVATVGDLAAIPRSLPFPAVPMLRAVPSLLVPALSLAFVGAGPGGGHFGQLPQSGRRLPRRFA
jgi:SulP family sulfate permease